MPDPEIATHITNREIQRKATILIVNYNGIDDLPICLASLVNQTYSNYEIIVVDSASTDGSVAFIRREFPQVKLLESQENLGYRRGNNLGFKAAQGDYVVLLNQDTEVAPDWIAEMVAAVESADDIGLVAPKILMFADRQKINEIGNTLHYSGLCGSNGLGQDSTHYIHPETLAAVSGCSFLIRRDLLDQLGGFAENFDLLDTGWHASFEDADLGWRAQLMGYRIYFAPNALLYHKYTNKGMQARRFCSYEFGRWLLVLLNWGGKTLFCLLPILVIVELGMWAYAVMKGTDWVKAKWKVAMCLLRNLSILKVARHRVQSLRRVGDAVILRRMPPTINIPQLVPQRRWDRFLQRSVNWIFSTYYRGLVWALSA
jgi:GT2 family glycosyltransferase